jgi:hypothetical protein
MRFRQKFMCHYAVTSKTKTFCCLSLSFFLLFQGLEDNFLSPVYGRSVPLKTRTLLYKGREHVIIRTVDCIVWKCFVFRYFLYDMNVRRLCFARQDTEYGRVHMKARVSGGMMRIRLIFTESRQQTDLIHLSALRSALCLLRLEAET